VNHPHHNQTTGLSKRRLGDHLLSQGLLNTSQLEEAIEYQCIYGGRLGTSLIELGLVNEDQMARTLSQQLKLHYIKPDLMMDVPTSILNLVPVNIALKHKIVPYYKEGKKLYVAINDFSNLKLLDELSFQLNHVITPLAVPEVRLMLALKKHYRMTVSPRFETIAAQLLRRDLAVQKKTAATIQKETANNQKPANDNSIADTIPWPLLGDESADSLKQEDFEYTVRPEDDQEQTVDVLSLLAEAKERDDIGQAVISYLRKDFPKCGFFVVRKGISSGWLASGGNPEQSFDHFHIPLSDDSVCGLISRNRRHFLGQMSDTEQNRNILTYFNSKPPQHVLGIPLMVQDRMVCILYIQGPLEKLEQHFAELHTLVGKAEMAFKLLILKNKILSL